ncbi:MAG TPA: ABC transporter permease [Acidimicrobiales bacterium]|nr:ABC transporter permease [Acidimicrobiales bacterium]
MGRREGWRVMGHFISQLFHWYTTGSHWRGSNGVPALAWATVKVTAEAVLIALAVGLPLALWLGHTGRGGFLAINVTNVGRALPAIALLVIGVQILGIGEAPALAALVVLSLPPVVTNTYTAVRQVDPDAVDAARGMGMTGTQILFRVELPASLPLIAAGVRTAAVQAVATVTLAAYVAYNCLGSLILQGLSVNDHVEVVAGALLVIVLAFLTELGLAALQRALTPAGVKVAENAFATTN